MKERQSYLNSLSKECIMYNSTLICLFYNLSFRGKVTGKQRSHSFISIVKGQRSTVLLYEQHQSEDNSFWLCPSIDTVCCRCWSVCIPPEGHGTLFFISKLRPQIDSQPYHRTPRRTREHEGGLASSLSLAHPLYLRTHSEYFIHIKRSHKQKVFFPISCCCVISKHSNTPGSFHTVTHVHKCVNGICSGTKRPLI